MKCPAGRKVAHGEFSTMFAEQIALSRMIRSLGLLCLVGMMLCGTSVQTFGQGLGDLAVSPSRVIFEGRTRTAKILLLNRGAEAATYRISIVNMRMSETGKFERIKEPDEGQRFATPMMRFAPRQVVLAPNSSQTVRVLLRKPKGLPEGEYRSHLYFSAVPQAGAGRSIESTDKKSGIRVRLTVLPGITIPVIVRHGKLAASADFSGLALTRPSDSKSDRPYVSVKIKRDGNRSLFGDVTVTFKSASGEYILARINKLAVYTPNVSRRLQVPLNLPNGVRLAGGRLDVVYRARSDDGSRVLAEGQLKIP